MGPEADDIRAQLPDVLAAAGLAVSGIDALQHRSGGSSRETWSFTAHTDDGAQRPLILQLQHGFSAPIGVDTAGEAVLVSAAAGAGVPVPALVASGRTPSWPLPYLVLEHVAGETIPQRILRAPEFADVRPALAEQFGAALGRLHTIDPSGLPLPEVDPVRFSRATLAELGRRRPALQLAIRWLEENRPEPAGRVVCHGDFRPGNAIIGTDGLRAVIDWELAHVGDPLEDLAWCCLRAWRFGRDAPVGGFGGYRDLLAGYRASGGCAVEPGDLHWWLVAGNLRWATICAMQAHAFRTGARPSVEMAAVGRRLCEAEFDLLLLLPEAAR